MFRKDLFIEVFKLNAETGKYKESEVVTNISFSLFFMSFSCSIFIDSSPCRLHFLSSLLLWFRKVFSEVVDIYVRRRSRAQRLSLFPDARLRVPCRSDGWVSRLTLYQLGSCWIVIPFFYGGYSTGISQLSSLDDNLGPYLTMKLVVVETNKEEVRA